MKATLSKGKLKDIEDCYIEISDFNIKIIMNNLPDISDSKSASYGDESAIGRSAPFKSYQWSDNRSISWTAHFYTIEASDVQKNINILRALEACVYPKDNANGLPYSPPPILKIKCGKSLGESDICVIMRSYSVRFDSSVPWDGDTLLPYKLDIDMQFEAVYDQSNLPGSEKILSEG